MALKNFQIQLRVIWDCVRFLTEAHMHPTPENKNLLARAEKKFSECERPPKRKQRPRAKLKTLSSRSAR